MKRTCCKPSSGQPSSSVGTTNQGHGTPRYATGSRSRQCGGEVAAHPLAPPKVGGREKGRGARGARYGKTGTRAGRVGGSGAGDL